MSITFGAGITLGAGITVTASSNSFTINSSDLSNGQAIYQNTTALGTNGVDGFENTGAENWLGEGYSSYNLSPGLVAAISAAYNTVGLATNSSIGYLWNVTWGAGSTIASGVVKFGFYDGGGNPASAYILIQAIDTANTNYQNPNNNNGTSLVGTFLFPATFTIYDPLTNKSNWC